MLTLNQVLERIDVSLPTYIDGAEKISIDLIQPGDVVWNSPVKSFTVSYNDTDGTYENYIEMLFF